MDFSSISKLLSDRAFSHDTQKIELVETHISWVILTGDLAYKIKKPVDLGFLDFSTLEQRKHFCDLEIELNRRYTPALYLGVVAVTGTPEQPEIDGGGPVIDYAVKMVQFSADALLDTVSKNGGLGNTLVRAIAVELAKTHRDFPAVTSATDNPSAMEAAMIQNFDQVKEYAIDKASIATLDSLENWTRQHLETLLPLMAQRVQGGHVKDLHGDLHLSNMIVMDGAVKFFDCIEFNKNFRLMDTMADIAFLAMDMADRGEAAQTVLNDYLEYSGDYAGLAVLDLYRVYFAMVRAKVNLMQEPIGCDGLQQTTAYQTFRRFIALATTYAGTKPPFIALMHGVAGTGKSTVAAQIAEHFGAIRVRSDVERKRLFGLLPDDSSESIDSNIYSAQATQETYAHLLGVCRSVIAADLPCVVDATFLQHATRQSFRDLAAELGVPVLIVNCTASQACIVQRLEARRHAQGEASEAGIEVMQLQLSRTDPLAVDEQCDVLDINTELPFDAAIIERQLV